MPTDMSKIYVGETNGLPFDLGEVMKKLIQWLINSVVIIMMIVSVVLFYVSDRVSYNDKWKNWGIITCLPFRGVYNDVMPDAYYNSSWKSDEHGFVIEVYDERYESQGYLIHNNEKASVEVYFFETDIVVLDEIKAELDLEDKLMFQGECEYYRTKCEITVTHSNLDEIEVGDMIVLERQ